MRVAFRATFDRFVASEARSAILLGLATVVALAWANLAPAGYRAVWEHHVGPALGAHGALTVRGWINDGLMAVFFLLVGLEIKREVLVGELSSPQKAALPIVAAAGGMIVPAALYAAMNAGTDAAPGWPIPMATDIAFALGALALLGGRVPVALKVFLTAIAIVDDLGAVLVIALFLSHGISLPALGTGLGVLGGQALANRAGVVALAAYLAPGLVVWGAFLLSGVHATIAGVLVALCVPARADAHGHSPLTTLEHALAPVVAYGIVPLFALANAGISFGGAGADLGGVTVGVALGLLLGKPLGIGGACLLAVRTGVATLPAGVTRRGLVGVSILAGIGFTMSLFMAELALPSEAALEQAKVGIVVASTLAGVAGFAWLRDGRGRV